MSNERNLRYVTPTIKKNKNVPIDVMENIYNTVKTPFKDGVVLKGENGEKVDCPGVFKFHSRWYMVYIIFDGNGYDTALVESDDLLHWKPLGKILSKRKKAWDAKMSKNNIPLTTGVLTGVFIDPGCLTAREDSGCLRIIFPTTGVLTDIRCHTIFRPRMSDRQGGLRVSEDHFSDNRSPDGHPVSHYIPTPDVRPTGRTPGV